MEDLEFFKGLIMVAAIIIIGMIVFDWLGISPGQGGNPQESYMDYR